MCLDFKGNRKLKEGHCHTEFEALFVAALRGYTKRQPVDGGRLAAVSQLANRGRLQLRSDGRKQIKRAPTRNSGRNAMDRRMGRDATCACTYDRDVPWSHGSFCLCCLHCLPDGRLFRQGTRYIGT